MSKPNQEADTKTTQDRYFQHYKGKFYRYHGLVRHSETLEELVLYEALYENEKGKMWVRPHDMFFSDVQIAGGTRKRFKEISADEYWKAKLDSEQYHVMRECGTESPFTGRYYKHNAKGDYLCAGCGIELFKSDTKFESGTGWPSFWNPADHKAVRLIEDVSHGMMRTEVRCANCDAHLGHLFDDGPKPTGLRYCINSLSLDFKESK